MKKLMLTVAAFVAVTMVSSAASMAWDLSTKAAFGGVTLSANVSSYLIYLGDSSTIEDVNLLSNNTASSIISAVGTDSGSMGSMGSSGVSKGKVAGTLNPVVTGQKTGDYFAVLLTYNDGSDTWFNLTTAAASNFQSGAGVWDKLSISGVSYSTVGESNTLSAGTGWTKAPSVPEPATGALALAGLALLFRRRRA